MASDNERCFTLFPKFPKELRLKIWKHSLPGPRIIQIDYNYNDGPGLIDHDHHVKCRAKCPAMLHVNSEAREVAQKIYKPLFAQDLGHPVFFDLENDFAYFCEPTAFEGWIVRSQVNHFNGHDNDPADFRWELRNIIVHPEILCLDLRGAPLRAMRSLSTLVIHNQGPPGFRPINISRHLWCLNVSWLEVHGQDVPFPKHNFMTWQEIEGIIAVSDIWLLNLLLQQC
jgi:hypothetical protein